MTDEVRADWEAMRARTPELRSPFLSVAFANAVEKVRPGLQVGLIQNATGLVGALPFRRKGSVAVPPAGGVNDYHGLITPHDTKINPLACLKAFGLRHYNFHASPAGNPLTDGYRLGTRKSFLADLTTDPAGYEHYLRSTSTTVDRQDQKTRRLQRELGPLRFEFDCRDEKMLELLINYKCQQYARNHTYPVLAVDWIRSLLFELFRRPSDDLRGILNVLYFGSTPVAFHFGMLEHDLMHYWYQVYSPEHRHGSPGTQLFIEVVREATARGYKSIDMGPGEQAYKLKLTNVVTEIEHGIVSASPLRRHCHRAGTTISGKLRDWGWYQRIKPVARRLFPQIGGKVYAD